MRLQEAIHRRVGVVLATHHSSPIKLGSDPSMEGFVQIWSGLPKSDQLKQLKEWASDPSFAKTVKRDRSIPAPVRRQVDLLHKLRVLPARGKQPATPVGRGGKDGRRKYKIGYDKKRKRWLCSCPDWFYRRSWLTDTDPNRDCKHIVSFRKRVYSRKH